MNEHRDYRAEQRLFAAVLVMAVNDGAYQGGNKIKGNWRAQARRYVNPDHPMFRFTCEILGLPPKDTCRAIKERWERGIGEIDIEIVHDKEEEAEG